MKQPKDARLEIRLETGVKQRIEAVKASTGLSMAAIVTRCVKVGLPAVEEWAEKQPALKEEPI